MIPRVLASEAAAARAASLRRPSATLTRARGDEMKESDVRPVLAALALAGTLALPSAGGADEGWIPLFDGHSLAGWKAAEHPGSISVRDGALVCEGPRAHVFYLGPDGRADFTDFELQAEVRARAGANSGLYFHTAYQETDWPKQGFEVQVNNSQRQHDDYLEMKKTGSLYGIRNVYKAMAGDDEWFRLEVTVRRPRVEVRVNGTLVVDYREPTEPASVEGGPVNRLGHGTFALQCHDPESRVSFRDLRVRRRPPLSPVEAGPEPTMDARYRQVLSLGRANFPLVDLHVHLKGGLTLEQALARSRSSGIGFGLAVNCGRGFPIADERGARAFVEEMKGQPVFVGMQGEGREWVSRFSKETRALFDYVFTDAMTFTDLRGRRVRLWIPEEVEVGDEQAFMDMLVDRTVGVLENEPIDVWVNPTFIPAVIAPRYDELWTEARMRRVIEAAVRNGVAIEMNARYRIPSERFLRRAKAAGAKFTIGTNNSGPADLGDWSYPLDMVRALDLKWTDMFVPGHAPSRARRP
jgi:hypothetical protein